MKKLGLLIAILLLVSLFVSGFNFNVVQAQQLSAAHVDNNAEVNPAVKHDLSANLTVLSANATHIDEPNKAERPLRLVPFNGATGGNPDTAVQTSVTTQVASSLLINRDGVGNGFSGPNGTFTVKYSPSDTTGAVGATQYVQWVNDNFAVFDKATGAVLKGPLPGNTLWQGFGGGCEVNNDGDPFVAYDKIANRWVLSQFSVSSPTTYGYLQCVAVSQTSDATGAYYRYAFSYSGFNDYPKMGVWPDGYYETFNMFNGNTFSGSKVCAYDRTAMLTGAAASQICFQLSTSYGGVLASDLDGSNLPAAGTPNYLFNFGSNSLNMWKFHTDFANPANATLTGPTSIAVSPFSVACKGGACIPQPNTRQKLDSLADRLMYRVAYRNFGDHESLVINHSVSVGSAGSGIRWYEIRTPGTTPTVYQQGTYAPDATYRWMGSAAMDKLGNLAVGYSASSTSVYPSVRYTARLASDPLGTLQAESTIQNGGGAQQRTLSRWGDYSSMTIDPTDDCTFWYTTEYLKADGTFNWSTRIASFKLPSCV